ncbi:MAG TPA: bifunctional proline dehydrogenase/L-glutamate gamma-semialdehyde dehydrogenase PutA [Afifellaceae bacterium]|nr:bifunctional proline dehydrogenase/L-glutamate gamma-semialdehyde dehydrogenase PutA [Afifellaceae bacterium]
MSLADDVRAATRRIAPFRAEYAPDDEALVRRLLGEIARPAEVSARIAARARSYVEGIRAARGGIGGVEDFMHEYSLSTREGLALMTLAEALLRVPDAATQDRLIEDKLGSGDWEHGHHDDESWLVSATTWALGLSARILTAGETPESLLARLSHRLGMPTIRAAARQAMRVLGQQFVLGETVQGALGRARQSRDQGYRHSFDMLGEGARTKADAERYFEEYAHAIAAIGAAAGEGELPNRPGISVKLSALSPKFTARHRRLTLAEVTPQMVELARAAKADGLNLTIDAEEADRLELTIDVFRLLLQEKSLAGWDGLGLAVQAYQKRAVALIDWLAEAATASNRRLMVRLVKGAYWDTEVKRAQERGLDDFPVFTRKPATDVSYIACAGRMLAARPRLYPQFATHNALTVATLIEMAGDREFEFQRLHGMGEALYRQVAERDGFACRVYAPVGHYRELLPYLVRRLLENGANSSFVNLVNDPDVPVDSLIAMPEKAFADGKSARHARIAPPLRIFGERRNSRGIEFGDARAVERLVAGIRAGRFQAVEAAPLIAGKARDGPERPVVSPVDGSLVGTVRGAEEAVVEDAVPAALAGFSAWEATAPDRRAAILDRAADLIEERRDRLMALMGREGGKTLDDGIAEVREAADFCRYYAAEARRLCADRLLPGPAGEENRYRLRGRGPFVCISPWNFPLAIFLGQVTAALAAGNSVVAKPAEQTPLVAFEAVKLLYEAGVPPGALHLLPGDGRVGAALVADPRIAGVAFTGSTEVGRAINRALAAKDGPIVPLIAETGGINAMIADATALPEQVTDDVVTSAFRSAGQRCSASRLLLLQDDVADQTIAMIAGAARELRLGDPVHPATDMGPVIDADARQALLDYLDRIRHRPGYRLVHAGEAPRSGTFLAPHIVEIDDPRLLTEEVFGPILHVARFKANRLDEMVAAVRDSGYGLTFGLHTRVGGRAERIARALQVGNVYINRNTIGAVVGSQPFGGFGFSGTGPKAGGPNYLPRFALEQVVSTDTTAAGGNASLVTMEDVAGGGAAENDDP